MKCKLQLLYLNSEDRKIHIIEERSATSKKDFVKYYDWFKNLYKYVYKRWMDGSIINILDLYINIIDYNVEAIKYKERPLNEICNI